MRKVRPVFNCECGDHSWVNLTRGFVGLFSPEFAASFGLWNWNARFNGKGWYVGRSHHENVQEARVTVSVRMHQMVLPVSGKYVPDHINGNGLDNRRSNLRVATYSQNAMNQKPRFGDSKYRGVTRAGTRWRALIGVNGRQIYLGKHATEIEAAQAYDDAAKVHHGEFANLNFSGTRASGRSF